MKLVSGIVDSGFFAQSALSAEVATKDSLGRNISETYLTAVDIPESAAWNATTETVSSNSAQWGASNPQIPVTGINGIKISESGDKVVFEVSADYYPGNNPSGFITGVDLSDYATTAQVSEKLDTTAFSTVSGNFLTAVDLTPYQEKEEMTAYATVESLTAKQDAGDYLSASDSANFLLTSDSGNFYTTANESGFITGVDLTPYQLTADMTAYQPVGEYLTTADSANFYTTANESGFISEVPAGTMNESAFSYDASDNITAYNGSAFKAGDEFPQSATEAIETVTANSADWNGTTDTVSSNSGVWGGEALPISADGGVKVEYTNGMLVFKQDRTLLYSGNTQVTGFTASEPLTNFERVEFVVSPDPNLEGPSIITYPMINANTARINLGWVGNFDGWRNISWNYLFNTNNNIVYTAISGSYFGLNSNGATAQGIWSSASLWLLEINGINRTAGV